MNTFIHPLDNFEQRPVITEEQFLVGVENTYFRELVYRTYQVPLDLFYKHVDKVDWEFILKNCKISHHTLMLLIAKKFDTKTKFYFLQQLKGNYDHLTNYKVVHATNV